MGRQNLTTDVEGLVRSALDTLRITPETLLLNVRRRGSLSLIRTIRGLQWNGISFEDWVTLSSILCLPVDSVTNGYQKKIHVALIKNSIMEGRFQLPIRMEIIKLTEIYLSRS